ncbi:urease accessory protein UreD [Streptosporangium sp. KLBMP 9127]|nr:urease accessory protein UreD [Streptosporangium sp. KLBMP 9127]
MTTLRPTPRPQSNGPRTDLSAPHPTPRTTPTRGTASRTMTAHAEVVAEVTAAGRTVLSTLRSAPPLTLRQTGPERVHLVASAAGPLGGDHLRLDLRVGRGARLEVGSIASTLVLPGPGESVVIVNATVEPGGTLTYAPEPTVLATGCHHRMIVRLALAEDAVVSWREEIVFGRHGEPPGRCHSRFDATVAGRPLLRQEFTVGDPALDRSPAIYGDARCVGSLLLAGAAPRPHQVSVTEGRAVLPLAGPGTLISALAPDAVTLRRHLTHS